MLLRTGTSSDIDAVLAFWQEATTVASATDDAESLVALLGRSPDALIVAEDDGALVGTAIAGWDGWRGAMYRVAVHPEARRRGIASAMVGEGERRLRAHGARRLHMIVDAGEAPAQRFWRSAGYARTDQCRFVKTLD
jgi:ribosomal protein S18 acetylase RimI-like enzyme